MAEAGPSVNSQFYGNRRGNRGAKKGFNKQREEEELLNAPKIIIKKRPPRRPKLPNGTYAPCVTITQVIENSNDFIRPVDDCVLQTNNIAQIVHIEQEIKKIGEDVHAIRLSQESIDITESTPEPSSPEKTSGKTRTRTRNRRRRNRNKNDSVSYENEELNDYIVTQASTSTYIQDVETKKEKPKLVKRGRNKVLRPQRSTSDDRDAQDNSDGHENSPKVNKNHKKEKRKREKKVFTEHLPIEVVRDILAAQNPEKPNIIEGNIRINPRYYQNAYVPLATGEQDVLIVGLKDRNRALEGDLVAVIINSQDKWFKLNESTCQKTGYVVSILEKCHPRKAVGFLEKKDIFVFLKPRDSRIPILKINPVTVPRNFYDNPDLFKETLFLCNIVDWKKIAFAEGEIQQVLGNKGDLTIETNAILLENDLVLTPYEDELLQDLPPNNYIPTASDIAIREDLRETCIFTIDPATAVDLDDAMSCRPLENGNFEVGIHIADVTHFLEAFSPLDRRVAERATTVYMVDNVYHMLPKQLTMVCSLLPGLDKLAFSVILEMTPTGEIVKHRFAKSVMNSCCQMSYDQAQIMIDNEDYDWEADGKLKIKGNYTPKDLCQIVRNLYDLSTQLRKRRFDEGALRIDQPKLIVFLDPETRLPTSYKLDERKESNSLIEEFMLLANMTVAKHLYEVFPEVALLRSHAEPSMRILQKTRDLLIKFGVFLNVESAGTLHNSLIMHQPDISDEEHSVNMEVAESRLMVINSLCAKSMMRAQYKCSSTAKTKDKLRHYALNAEFYTHFTSPIRRYPDCIVHRLLHASISNKSLPEAWTSQVCTQIANNCNTKKYSAKLAQEQSSALYFTYMLDLLGSMITTAIVMDVKERSADAMLCDTGLKLRIYYTDTVEETTTEFSMEQDVPTVKLLWLERNVAQVISIFSILYVKITKHPQLFRLQGIILPPVNGDLSSE